MSKRYQKGDKLKAADVNRIVDRQSKPQRVTASGGVKAVTTADGVHLVGPLSTSKASVDYKTVVVTVKPVESDYYVRVRQVAYVNYPPLPCVKSGSATTCAISYVGDEILAIPEYGKTAVDYADFSQDTTTNPTEATTFLRIRREEGYWLLDFPSKGGSEVGVGVITSVANQANVYTAMVQPIKVTLPDPPAAQVPVFSAKGSARPMLLWPNGNGADFQSHIGTVGASATQYVMFVNWSGVEVVFPTYLLYTVQPGSTVNRGDCTVT